MYGGIKMTVGTINGTDITLYISQLKGAYPQGAARKTLAQVLKDFVTSTGADLKSVDVIVANGKKVSILDFVKQVDGTNDLPSAYLLQNACKNSKVIAEEVIPKVQKFKSDQKWHSGAEPVRITLDLRTAQAKPKSASNVVIGQVSLNPQEIIDPNRNIKQTGNALTVDDKENGFKLVYSEKWLLNQLDKLGYFQKIV